MGKPHALLIPYAAQGHVIPMMELMQRLVNQGVKVTFLNTDFTHKLVTNAFSTDENLNDLASFVSLPDGVEAEEDRKDVCKLAEAIFQLMPSKLEELINKLNINEGEKVTCIVADTCMGWAFEVADKMRIKSAAFWTASAAGLALLWSIPKFLEDGIIDNKGILMKKQMVQLSPTMPAINSENFMWARIGDMKTQETAFHFAIKTNEFVKLADCVICNSAYELETSTFTSFPDILPIGPLLASNRVAKQIGHFWKEDSTCLTWLDQHPIGSVIYVAFGSFTVFDSRQFDELAVGLEMTNMPFLWVVRPDMFEDMKNDGFDDRVSERGKIVGWAPQQKVLNHPSVGCFVSHCGWNSVLEGVTNGLPFLCWPYFSDQFINQMYISDVWKTGLEFEKDESGIVSSEEIKNKIEQVLENKEFKVRAIDLKEKVAVAVGAEGSHSDKNFSNFIDWIQDTNN
ncbi:UDP-glycosyltransferase 83A1 [Lactuca sativa]|uniref:UDP-glycosyltransferase 83A1 n=1 Tax=Lactuca sativa TaxID=4236 RepID=UPI000CAAB6B3|nr:UDP-glycosyltransferase 83A1 [Lactuca sativa]